MAKETYDIDLQNLKAVTVPDRLKGVSVKMVVESSPCSTSCGLGNKKEKRCIVGPSGKREDCETVSVSCVVSWICGMTSYTLTVGQPFTMNCLIVPAEGQSNQGLNYYWYNTKGQVTTQDDLFRPLRIRYFNITFPAIKESDAGSYRCDVQHALDFKLIKRVYYAVKVIPPSLVNLNYGKSLMRESELEAMAAQKQKLTKGNLSEKVKAILESHNFIIFGVGGSAAVIVGGAFWGFFYLIRKRRRKRRTNDVEDGVDDDDDSGDHDDSCGKSEDDDFQDASKSGPIDISFSDF
ncbi:transmembrane protein 81-like [Spea bombifrons]|uniref:transmembrane protein 81-like n=1 Tax=Spea bombifrons TaxID=233779 RepID=UPI0023497C0A|nr:transmembrane protein 81-like [Spea bombifrons]